MNKLLEYFDAERGRRMALATHLEISPSAISMWTQVPTERVKEVAKFTGLSARDLRPDLAVIFAEDAGAMA